MSPRVKAVIEKVKEIREELPEEKIVVVSRFVRFLDILQAVMDRQGVADTTNFTDYVAGPERIENLRQFGQVHGGPRVLFLSAKAGGTGLNITRASHLIICDPPWTPGDKIQLTGRLFRLRQTRNVMVYDVVGKP